MRSFQLTFYIRLGNGEFQVCWKFCCVGEKFSVPFCPFTFVRANLFCVRPKLYIVSFLKVFGTANSPILKRPATFRQFLTFCLTKIWFKSFFSLRVSKNFHSRLLPTICAVSISTNFWQWIPLATTEECSAEGNTTRFGPNPEGLLLFVAPVRVIPIPSIHVRLALFSLFSWFAFFPKICLLRGYLRRRSRGAKGPTKSEKLWALDKPTRTLWKGGNKFDVTQSGFAPIAEIYRFIAMNYIISNFFGPSNSPLCIYCPTFYSFNPIPYALYSLLANLICLNGRLLFDRSSSQSLLSSGTFNSCRLEPAWQFCQSLCKSHFIVDCITEVFSGRLAGPNRIKINARFSGLH